MRNIGGLGGGGALGLWEAPQSASPLMVFFFNLHLWIDDM
jgi:hypothetical protein